MYWYIVANCYLKVAIAGWIVHDQGKRFISIFDCNDLLLEVTRIFVSALFIVCRVESFFRTCAYYENY